MTSTNYEQVHDLFGLDKNEKINEDFNCFLVESLPIIGQLYITENHICFYSNLFFFNRNITIPLSNITKLNFNTPNIEIDIKNAKNEIEKYKFTANENIQTIYDKINSSISLLKLDSKDIDDSSMYSKKTADSSEFSSKEFSLNNENEEIKFNEIGEDDYEVCKKIINISPKDLFNKYYTNSFPETCFEKFYEWAGDHSNVKISDWEKIENNENNEIEKFKKTENFSLSLHNVPMVDHSEVSITLTYFVENGIYYIHNSSKNKGIPFADSFTVEGQTELYPYMNGTKTVYRTYVRSNFLQSTFLKGLISSQTKTSYTEEIKKWLEFIQEKGEHIEGDYVFKGKELDNIHQNNDNNKENEDKEKVKKKVDINYLYEKVSKKMDKRTISIIVLLLAIIITYFIYKKK